MLYRSYQKKKKICLRQVTILHHALSTARLFPALLLPPANEVWGKVMFYTCLSVHGGKGVCLQGGLHLGGVCLQGGLPKGSASAGVGNPSGTRKADGAHPTRMLSCFLPHFSYFYNTKIKLYRDHARKPKILL